VREGNARVSVLDAPAPLAALGDAFTVDTLDGEASVEVHAGTQPGEVLVVKGEGLPDLRRGRRGDLRVVVNVVIPRRLTKDQRELLHRLADSMTDENLDGDGESMFGKLRRVLRNA